MSSLINNTWADRHRIRCETFFSGDGFYREYTPVLLIYWTKESLNLFLIPATPEEFEKLSSIRGIDENGEGWEPHKETFHWLKNKIDYQYEDGDGDIHPQGEWREKYFIDVADEDGKPLPVISSPPGTVFISTGIIL